MGTEVLDYKKEQAKELEDLKKRIQSAGGNKIRATQDKQWLMPDGTKKQGTLSMVILDFVYSNQWFDRPFNKDDMTVPACFSFGMTPKGLIPEKISPILQTEEEDGCDVCPNNQYKSHANGKGKACNNIAVLAVAHPDPAVDKNIYKLHISATGITAFGSYVLGIKAQFDALPIGVVTQFFFDPGNTFPSIRCGDPTPNENIALHWALKAAAREQILTLPDVSQFKPYEAPKKVGPKPKKV